MAQQQRSCQRVRGALATPSAPGGSMETAVRSACARSVRRSGRGRGAIAGQQRTSLDAGFRTRTPKAKPARGGVSDHQNPAQIEERRFRLC